MSDLTGLLIWLGVMVIIPLWCIVFELKRIADEYKRIGHQFGNGLRFTLSSLPSSISSERDGRPINGE